jgi:hypothetical protein
MRLTRRRNAESLEILAAERENYLAVLKRMH